MADDWVELVIVEFVINIVELVGENFKGHLENEYENAIYGKYDELALSTQTWIKLIIKYWIFINVEFK